MTTRHILYKQQRYKYDRTKPYSKLSSSIVIFCGRELRTPHSAHLRCVFLFEVTEHSSKCFVRRPARTAGYIL